MSEQSSSPPAASSGGSGSEQGGSGSPMVATVLGGGGVAIAVVALIVAAFAMADGDGEVTTVAAGEPMTVEVEMGEMWFEPSVIEVAPGTELTVELTNVGDMPHDLVISDDVGSSMLDPGESETVSLGVIESTTQAWCTVPGHREAGMELDIVVTGDEAVAAAPDAAHAGDHAEIDFNAAPDADWQPFDPELQPAPGGTEHELTIRATETEIEVAPGVTQELWTYDDQVPGTTLRGNVGDLFTITFINDGDVPHSIDFHASKVAWNDEMRTIGSGEELVYQFEAKHAGIFMYHCGTDPALHHIGNGMHGAIIIDPPDLPEVDHEFLFVQSEYYLGPEGGVGDLTKMVNDEWDAVTFNGYVNQYVHEPIRVETDERIRAWVLNNGPSENSSWHVVGSIFDTVYKEGEYLLQPGEGQGGSQAIDLQPSQGGFVEFTFDADGLYPFVTHKFSNVGKGGLGLFQAGEVEIDGDVSH